MEEPLNICLTCLSTNRCLLPLHKITMLLEEIRFEELKQHHGGVCWECWSVLAKFYRLKKRAKIAQETLLQTTEHFNIKSLSTLTLKTITFYDYQYSYSIDPLTNCNTELKTEPDSIKQEPIDNCNDITDYTLDVDEKIVDYGEEIENVYDNVIETKGEDNILSNKEVLHQSHGIIDKGLDFHNSNILYIPQKIENVYVDMIGTIHNDESLKKQDKKGIENDFTEIIFNETKTKFNKEHIYEKKSNKNGLKRKNKKDLEKDLEKLQDKFEQVVLSEEDMLKGREEKRSHHNFKRIPYKCDTCVLGFTKKDKYIIHMRKKHDESIGDQVCDVCCIRFPFKLALNNHRSKHFVMYRCRMCKYESHEITSVVNHCMIKHKADKPDSIHCSQCNVIVKTPDDLENHMQTEHTLFCDCGIKFKHKSSLRSHLRRAHSESRNFICDICKKTFKTKMRLESHIVKHCGNIAKKLAYCTQCNVQYKNVQVYRNHLKSSANHSEGYPCSRCNKKFKAKSYLKQHIDFYHLKNTQYKCEDCNKIFISNWCLRNHRQQYHGLTRPRNHCCNTCGKKFFTSATLRSHQLTHSDLRSFMCEDCGDTFKQSAALYTHTRLVHKGGGSRKKNK